MRIECVACAHTYEKAELAIEIISIAEAGLTTFPTSQNGVKCPRTRDMSDMRQRPRPALLRAIFLQLSRMSCISERQAPGRSIRRLALLTTFRLSRQSSSSLMACW